MSIGSSPFQGGGSASVADATETTAGKIRIATSAEAATGTNDLIAMTPLTVKERIDASLVGAVQYRGTFNATAGTPSLANAEQGDLYIIDTAGTIYGASWSIGDHLLINADMGGVIDSAKIDKVDNTNEDASETVKGIIEISTNAEATAATATDKALVPSNLSSINVGTLNDDNTYLKDLIDDTTPELGGNLITNGFAITSTGSEDVTIDPDGLGVISVGADLMPDADATHTIGDEDTRFVSAYTDINGAIRFKAKNDQGAPIAKGQAVYIKGISGTVPTVGLAQANSASTMPAFGLALENANDQAEVQIITFGNLVDVNTTTYSLSAGDTVYVSAAAAGSLTNSAPAGESNLIQNIGRVVRADASAGIIKVGGAGRSNATPNLNDGKIFLGNASNQAVSTALSAINLSSFNNDLSGLGNQINALQVKTSASYTAQANYVYIGGYTSGTQTITMPAASGATSGDIIGFTSNVAPRALSLVSSDGTTNDIVNQSNQAKGGSNGALSLTVNQQISWFIHNGSSWYEANAALASVATSGDYSDLSNTPAAVVDASETAKGIIEISTNAEATAATATDKALVPSNLSSINVGTLNNDAGYITSAPVSSVNTLTGAVVLSGNDIAADHTAVNYTAANANIDGHLSGIDTALASAGAVSSVNTQTGAVVLSANDLAADHTAVNYTAANANIDGHLSGIDTALASAGAVSSVNTQTGAVVLSANDLAADHTAVNYTAANANIDGHLSGIDTALASAGAVSSVNTLTGAVVLSGDDIAADHTAVNYTAANANVDGHLSGIDTALSSLGDASETAKGIIEISTNAEATAATATDKALVPSNLSSINVGTLNNDAGYITSAPVSSVNTLTGAVVLSGNDIAADHTAVNYTAANANIDGHLSGIDTALASAGAVSSVNTQTGAVVLSANDLAADHTAVNYTAANANIDGHLSGIDTALASAGGGGGFTYSAITSATNAQVDYHYSCGAGNQTFTVSLPDASSSSGRVSIKNVGTGTITIGRVTGTDTIDGAASNYVISAQNTAITLISNETDGWEIM